MRDDVEHPAAGRVPAVQVRARRRRSTARRPFDPPTGHALRGRRVRRRRLPAAAQDDRPDRRRRRGDLRFKISYDTEPDYDYVFVEAHTVGQDDWTTLPDVNGNTSDRRRRVAATSTGTRCIRSSPHYQTNIEQERGGRRGGLHAAARGTPPARGTRATGNSGGFQDWEVDLSAYAGKQVEVSITYVAGLRGRGSRRVRRRRERRDRTAPSTDATSFEADLGGWAAGAAPEGTEPDADSGSAPHVGRLIEDGPGIATRRHRLLRLRPRGRAGARPASGAHGATRCATSACSRSRAARAARPVPAAAAPAAPRPARRRATTRIKISKSKLRVDTQAGARRCGCPAARRRASGARASSRLTRRQERR